MASSRSLQLVSASLLPMLVALPAGGATIRKAATSRSVQANNSIIPLPLNPVVPAGQRLCAARTTSGLGYTMLRAAPGAKPAADDLVLVNYVGYLAASGVVFDQGQRSALGVNGVIPGFSEGLRMMGKGSIARFCIPATLGYGAQGTGPIPANADLVFQVELVDYRAAAEASGAAEAPAPDASEQKSAAPR